MLPGVGYVLKTAALENLYRQGVSLVITVDCGITALSQVKRTQRMGLDIIITDHHTPLSESSLRPAVIPPAIATVNPELPDSNYPFSGLAGVGVSLSSASYSWSWHVPICQQRLGVGL